MLATNLDFLEVSILFTKPNNLYYCVLLFSQTKFKMKIENIRDFSGSKRFNTHFSVFLFSLNFS